MTASPLNANDQLDRAAQGMLQLIDEVKDLQSGIGRCRVAQPAGVNQGYE